MIQGHRDDAGSDRELTMLKEKLQGQKEMMQVRKRSDNAERKAEEQTQMMQFYKKTYNAEGKAAGAERNDAGSERELTMLKEKLQGQKED